MKEIESISEFNYDIELHKMKEDLMNSINKHVKLLGVTQAVAAEIMKVSQARVSLVATGKINSFRYEMLFLMNERIKDKQ